MVFSILAGAGILLTDHLNWILFLRIIAGAAAATWVDFTILFASYYPKDETTRAMGNITVYNSLGRCWESCAGLVRRSLWLGIGVSGRSGRGIDRDGRGVFIVEKFEDNQQKK